MLPLSLALAKPGSGTPACWRHRPWGRHRPKVRANSPKAEPRWAAVRRRQRRHSIQHGMAIQHGTGPWERHGTARPNWSPAGHRRDTGGTPAGHRAAPAARRGDFWSGRASATGDTGGTPAGHPRATGRPEGRHLVRPRLSDSGTHRDTGGTPRSTGRRRRCFWSGRASATAGHFPLARPRSFASPARTARTNTKPKSISR